MRRFVFYLLSAAYTLYLAILYGSNSILLLFFVELVLPLLTLLPAMWVAWHTEVDIHLPIPVAEKGKKVPVHIFMKKHTWIPAGKIKIQVSSYFPMSQKPEKIWFYGRMTKENYKKGRYVLRMEYDTSCVGTVRMEISKVRCYDLIGLFEIPVPKKFWKKLEAESLLVTPTVSEVPVLVSRQSRDFAGESEVYSKEKGGDDASEIFRIRNYQPGDKLRSIHWKLSAKTGELMVCEESLPLGCPVLFFLDLYESPKRERKHRKSAVYEKRDSYLQVAASLSHGMVREGCRHYMIWYDSSIMDIYRYRIEKEEDVYEMMIQLGRMTGYSKPKDLEELYRQKYHELQYVTKMELNRDLELRLNEEKCCTYVTRPEKLEKQLGQQEIVV